MHSNIRVQQFISFSFISVTMRKVLAQVSVGAEHKELVLKDLKSIFKRIQIPLDILLQEENYHQDEQPRSPLFQSYPYITLTIPNYEQHRQYLEKIYKNNVLFSKFILLISKGENYDDLIQYRNEEILREHARNWNNTVSCTFESTPAFTEIEEQMVRVDKILGGMDIRGKISQIDAQKKFHLIQDHWPRPHPDDPNPVDSKVSSNKSLFKLFFGLEVVKCCAKGRRRGAANAGGIIISSDSRYSDSSEFIDYEEEETTQEGDTIMMDNMMGIIQKQQLIGNGCLGQEVKGLQPKQVDRRHAKRRTEKVLAKQASKKNPYLKKKYADQIVLSHSTMIEE